MRPTPDDLTAARLAETYRRATALRRRRLVLGGSVAVAVLAVATLAGVAWPGDEGDKVRTVAEPDGEVTTTTAPPVASVEPMPTEPPPTTDTTARARTPTTSRSTGGVTPTTRACRNSHDAACGPFRYDPAPVNQPMVVEVSVSPSAPKGGEEMVFTARVRDDGPARPGSCMNMQSYGDGSLSAVCTASCVAQPEKYGPWDPPAPENASFVETFRHTYNGPGTYTARFAYNAGADCTFSPYRSTGETSVQVTVSP